MLMMLASLRVDEDLGTVHPADAHDAALEARLSLGHRESGDCPSS